MHYADGFVTVRRALSGFVNPVQKRDSLYCVSVIFLRFATIDSESTNNAEINVSRIQANEHEVKYSHSKAIVHEPIQKKLYRY